MDLKEKTDLKSTLPDLKILSASFPEIIQVNSDLCRFGISMVFISIRKNRSGHVREISQKLYQLTEFKKIKTLIILDEQVDIHDISDAVWRFSNNTDPKRDFHVILPSENGETSHLVCDGTKKTREFDGFMREWPNILASEERTMDRIDEIWPLLGLGTFLPSPSRKYRKQLYKGGAVAAE